MVDTRSERKNPPYQQAEGAEQTVEYKKLLTVHALMETLLKVWPTETWNTTDFSQAVREMIKGVRAEDVPKLTKLQEKLQKTADAASVPEEERTPEQAQLVQEEQAAADTDGDGAVSQDEAMKRTYDLMMEMGLDYAAAIFRKKRGF